jgi:hypothetical protein
MKDRQVEPAEPCGVGEHVDFDDLPARDREAHHRNQPSPWSHDDARGTVHQCRLREPGKPREAASGERLLAHGPRTADQPPGAHSHGTGIGADHDIWVEHRQQRGEVTVARGSEEGVNDFPLVAQVGVGLRGRTLHPAAGGRPAGTQRRREDHLRPGRGHPAAPRRRTLSVAGIDTLRQPARVRQLIGLGVSLVGAPRLLLLDEPTTGLDPGSRVQLWHAIRRLVAAGTDVLLTTQYLDEADRLAADMVIIDHGRVIAAGTPAALKTLAGDDVIEVHVRDADALSGAAAVLSAVGRDPQVDPTTQRAAIAVEDGNHRLMQAICALDHVGVAVEDISLRRPTLDEVFLTLTGTSTDSTDPATGPEAA